MTTAAGRPFQIGVSDSSTVIAFIDSLSNDQPKSSLSQNLENVELHIEIIEKVCQQRIIFNSISVRRLIIEMYTVFDKCQKLSDSDKILDTSSCCNFSREYRSILLNSAIVHTSPEFFIDFALWSLYEKLYFNRGDGSILADIISWASESFYFVKQQVEKSAEEFDPTSTNQSVEFWRGVAVSLICCQFEECTALLSMLNGDPAVDRFLDVLTIFNTDDLLDEAKVEKIEEWKELMLENIKYGKYGKNENIIFLAKLLLGEEKYLQTMADKIVSNWWNLIPFYVLVNNPFATYGEFVNLAESCRAIFFEEDDEEKENDVFWCLISRNEASFYQHIMNNPWLSVHLIDLIYKATMDPELEGLRKNLITNYASSLILHSNLWEIGIGYLLFCGTEGLLRIETHIEGTHIEDDEMAEKLIEICEHNRLDDAKSCVTNTMTYRYLKMNEWSAALAWALKSDNAKTIDTTVSKIISSSHRDELASLGVFNSLPCKSVLALPSLTFLYSYQRFVKTMYTGEVIDCVQHLIPLIMMPNIPTQYYYDLFEYLIVIIKEDDVRTGVRFPKEVLRELSTFLATFSIDKGDLNEKYAAKVKFLKKMVALKLTESISKNITC